eukprot:12423278-Karenia_brevis.AAC.1
MKESMETLLEKIFTHHYRGLRTKRHRVAKSLGISLDAVVLDGHQKLTRRTCPVLRACLLPCGKLGQMTLMSCPDTPAQKKRLCRKHCCLAQRPVPKATETGETMHK